MENTKKEENTYSFLLLLLKCLVKKTFFSSTTATLKLPSVIYYSCYQTRISLSQALRVIEVCFFFLIWIPTTTTVSRCIRGVDKPKVNEKKN